MPVHSADISILADIYNDAIMNLGQGAYNEEQLSVWASFADDVEAFRRTLLSGNGKTLCVKLDGRPVAFGQLSPCNHIALLYCHSMHANKGYASAILMQLEDAAREKGVIVLDVKASIVARPFFERHGYHVIEQECVMRCGVSLSRYHMEKNLLAKRAV